MEHQRIGEKPGGVRPADAASSSEAPKPKPAAQPAGGVSLTTTGISGLDAQLGGGIPRGTTLLLLGEPTNAISVLSEQFAGGGVNSGDAVYFYEFDRPSHGVRDGVLSFQGGAAPQDPEVAVFDGYGPQFGGAAPADATAIPLDDAMGFVLKELQSTGPDRPFRLVVESLSSLVTPGREDEAVEFVKRVAFMAREVGGTALISVVKGLHGSAFETRLQHAAGGVFELGVEKKGFGLYSYLLVRKLVGVPDPVRLLLFKETEKGLWLESTKRVF